MLAKRKRIVKILQSLMILLKFDEFLKKLGKKLALPKQQM